MDLKIASLNVRGIGNNTKRREVFNWLRSKKLSIYMLQEVHCSENTADLWACEQKVEARNRPFATVGHVTCFSRTH